MRNKITFVVISSLLAISCSRKGTTSRVSIQLPQASFITSHKVESQTANPSLWNTSLEPASISDINCYILFAYIPEDGATGSCFDSADTNLMSFGKFVGGVPADGSSISLELTSGTARQLHIVGFRADSADLATACVDFHSVGPSRTKLSKPRILASKTLDLSPGDVDVSIQVSLENAKTIQKCDTMVSPAVDTPALAISNVSVSPTGTGTVAAPILSGTVVGLPPIHTTLHSLPTCTDTVYTSSQTVSTGSTFTLTAAPALTTNGSNSFYVKAVDSFGSETCAGPYTYIYDTVAPALTIANATAVSNANAGTFSGTCETGLNVVVSGSSTGTATCLASAWSYSTGTQTTDGTYSYTFTQTDSVGNATARTGTWTRTTVAPTLSLTSASSVTANLPPTFSGMCTAGLAISISGAASGTATCASGSWSYTAPTQSTDGTYVYTLSQTDANGNVGSVSATWIRYSVAPTLTITLSSPITSNSSPTFSGACTNGLTISITGDATTSISCSSGSWSFTVPTASTDGSYVYTFVQVDSAGNQTSVSATWIRSTVAPVLTLTPTNPVSSNSAPSFSGVCTNGLTISITGAATTSIACSSGAWTYSVPTESVDGAYTYIFSQIDTAGNQTSVSGVWNRGTVPPALTITSASNVLSNIEPTFSGACTNGLSVAVSGASSTSASCVSGAWTLTVPTKSTDGTYSYTFTQTDAFGNQASVSASWQRTTTAPTVTSFVVDEASPVNIPTIHVSFTSTSVAPITGYCVRQVSSAPTITDACWVNLASSVTQDISAAPYFLGHVYGSRSLYLFTKNSLNYISALSASGAGTTALDKATISYSSGVPTMHRVWAANTNSMYEASSELTVASGGPLYIRWRALGASVIHIDYTANESSWTPLATSLNNAINSGCSIDGPGSSDNMATGCFVGTSPSSSFFRIRVRAVSPVGLIAGGYSKAFNLSGYMELAGRAGAGFDFDGSAVRVATLLPSGNQVDQHGLVVDTQGNIYYRDMSFGIIKINASTRVASLFIKTTGTSSGDGGAASSATLQIPYKIGIDQQNNLYIHDHNRIRKVSQQTGIISTIVGGGSDTSLTSKVATQHQMGFSSESLTLAYIMSEPFTVLPNGDIFFFDKYRSYSVNPAQTHIWKYIASSGNLTPVYLSGTGYVANAGETVSNCNIFKSAVNFDPATSTVLGGVMMLGNPGSFCTAGPDLVRVNGSYVSITPISTVPSGNNSYFNLSSGMDGEIYGLHGVSGKIYKFNSTTGAWVLLAGTGSLGSCADGTTATSCAMNPSNIFVDAAGKVYFSDGGRIRVIHDDGTIVSIFGVPASDGDGASPLNAQFANLTDVGLTGTDSLAVFDREGAVFRELDISLDSISTIAGTGATSAGLATGVAATTTGLGFLNWEKGFASDPSTGSVYWKYSTSVYKLNRGTGQWNAVVGGGGTNYFGADSSVGTVVQFPSSAQIAPLLVHGNYVYVHAGTSSNQDVAIKAYDISNSYLQSAFVSLAGTQTSSCNSAVATTSCGTVFPANSGIRVAANPTNSTMLFASTGSNTLKYVSGSYIATYYSLSNGQYGFATRYDGTTDWIYYCDSSGAVHKVNVTTTADSAYAMPTGVKCNTQHIVVVSGISAIAFVYDQYGSTGVASLPW